MKEYKLFDLANKVNVIVNGNNDKIKQFRPVRSYGDIINLGDVVELSIRDKNQIVFETPKYIGSISAISKLSGGFRIDISCMHLLETCMTDEQRIDRGIEWIQKGTVTCYITKDLSYSTKDISLFEYEYVKLAKITSFNCSETKIETMYSSFIESLKKRENAVKEEKARRIKEEQEAKAALIKAEELRKQQEEERRSQLITITVGQWEDLISRIESLERDVSYLKE